VEQASQAAEKWHLLASGVKTPDESNALTSWLKPRPTNLPTFSAACSACLVLNFANTAKFKCKQAEACSTGVGSVKILLSEVEFLQVMPYNERLQSTHTLG
jgi:hypothetical protein